MTVSVTHYKLWCTTDSKWEYVWLTDTPTVCPTNSGHTIDTDSIVAIKEVSENNVTINEEDIPEGADPTGGFFQVSSPHYIDGSKYMSIPASIGEHVFNCQDDITKGVLSIKFITEAIHKKDEIEVLVSPDTLCAALTASVLAPISITSAAAQGTTGGGNFTQIVATGHNYASGDTVTINGNNVIPDGRYIVSNPITDEFEIAVPFSSASTTHGTVASNTFYVSDTSYLKVGRYLKVLASADFTKAGQVIDLTGETYDDNNRIIEVGSNYVVSRDAATQAFSAGTSAALVTTKMMQNFVIGPAWEYTFGDDKIGASYLPKNTIVRVVYTNNEGSAKDLMVYVEYLY